MYFSISSEESCGTCQRVLKDNDPLKNGDLDLTKILAMIITKILEDLTKQFHCKNLKILMGFYNNFEEHCKNLTFVDCYLNAVNQNIMCMWWHCFSISGLLYTKSSEILVVLKNFFDGTKKEQDGKTNEANVSTAALFAKLGTLYQNNCSHMVPCSLPTKLRI